MLLFFILSTQLRDMIPAVREALNLFVWALRQLDGQVYSYEAAVNKGVLPGSHAVDKRKLKKIHKTLVRALSLLEGSLPISHLNPGMHHFVHYALYTSTHGLLRIFWMFYFERYNKHMKNLIRDVSHPEVNLAKCATQDASASYITMAMTASKEYDFRSNVLHCCVLSELKPNWVVSEEDLHDLSYMGYDVDQFSVRCYAVAHITGAHFRAGEWGNYPRCGSVVTCVLDGQSYYARAKKFLSVPGSDCPGFVSVDWFGKPTYPSGYPFVVRVTGHGDCVREEYGSVLRITQLDPSRVIVEYTREPDTYYTMRDSGYDTCKCTV